MKLFRVSNKKGDFVYVVAKITLNAYLLAHKKLEGEYSDLKAIVVCKDLLNDWVGEVEKC